MTAARRRSRPAPWWSEISGARLATLDRYIATEIVKSFLLVLLVLLAIFSFFAFVEELEDIGKGRYRLSDILAFVALTTPRRALDLASVTALLGSVIALGALAGRGELTAMQAAGVSPVRIGWSALKPTLVFTVLGLLAGEFVVPALDQAAHIRRVRALSSVAVVPSEHGFWWRDGPRLLHVRRATGTNVLDGVDVYEFDEERRLRLFLRAARAEVGDGRRWQLRDVLEKAIGPDGVTTQRLASRPWESFIGRNDVHLVALPPPSLPFTDLARYVTLLRASGLDAARYELALWQKVSVPLAASAMVLLAIPFAFGRLRTVSGGQRVVVGATVGIAFHLADQVVARVGLLLNVTPAATALAPVGAIVAAAVWFSRRGP